MFGNSVSGQIISKIDGNGPFCPIVHFQIGVAHSFLGFSRLGLSILFKQTYNFNEPGLPQKIKKNFNEPLYVYITLFNYF